MSHLITAWVIPTLNRSLEIKRLFESYLRQTLKPDRVVVVDGSQDDRTQQICRSFQAQIKNLIYHHTTTLGLVAQKMQAFPFLQEVDYALFLDDDFELNDTAFEILCTTILQMPEKTCLELNFKTVIVGSDLTPNDQWNFIEKVFFLPHGDTQKRVLPSGANTWLSESTLNIQNEIKKVGFVSGGCSFLPIRLLTDDLRFYFNTALQRFGGYSLGEDVYLSVQLKKRGCLMYRVMHAWGIHYTTPATRPNYENMIAAKVHNYFLINQALSPKIIYRIAYWWSVVGYFLLACFKAISLRSLAPLRGLLRGLSSL
jgi:glycosyltransferase involved in cell wall biosynthesis